MCGQTGMANTYVVAETARKPKRPACRPGAEVHETVVSTYRITSTPPVSCERNTRVPTRDKEVPPMWRFQVDNNQAGAATWWLYGGNNEMVAWAGESFASLFNARRAA